MVFPFFSPAALILESRGPEEAKDPSGEKILYLIQIRLNALGVCEKYQQPVKTKTMPTDFHLNGIQRCRR
jgi:hypothetical protein